MRHPGLGRLWLPLLAVAVVVTVWLRTTGTEAAFAVTVGNSGNTVTANPDWKPPIITAATVRKTEGGVPGYVRAGGTYTVLATVVDDPSSNPPAGIASVKANVSSLTASATALALTGSALTVAGVTYTHASGTQTVTTGHAAGTFSGTVTASDAAVPANTSAAFPFSVIVDNTAPSPSKVTTTNAGGSSGAGVVGKGDTITYYWTSPIDPWSIVSGWDGTGSQTVTVQIVNGSTYNGGTGDALNVLNAGGTTALPLGSVALGNSGYVRNATDTFGGPTNATRSTMTWSASNNSITVTIGPDDAGGGSPSQVTSGSKMIWTPSSSAFDYAGNRCTTGTWTETTSTVKF